MCVLGYKSFHYRPVTLKLVCCVSTVVLNPFFAGCH
jgi:hypothetical protein